MLAMILSYVLHSPLAAGRDSRRTRLGLLVRMTEEQNEWRWKLHIKPISLQCNIYNTKCVAFTS